MVVYVESALASNIALQFRTKPRPKAQYGPPTLAEHLSAKILRGVVDRYVENMTRSNALFDTLLAAESDPTLVRIALPAGTWRNLYTDESA